MPRAKKKPEEEKQLPLLRKYERDIDGDPEWGGFINVRIDAETKEQYKAWLEGEGQSYWKYLEDLLAEGLKFGLSWDAENNCYIATLVGFGCLVDDFRYCLNSRSDISGDATALLVFKHEVLARGDWSSYKPRSGHFESWG